MCKQNIIHFIVGWFFLYEEDWMKQVVHSLSWFFSLAKKREVRKNSQTVDCLVNEGRDDYFLTFGDIWRDNSEDMLQTSFITNYYLWDEMVIIM